VSFSRIALALVALLGAVSPAPADEPKPPLVTRDRVQLNLAGAESYSTGRRRRPRPWG
jgi:hypothetical protein